MFREKNVKKLVSDAESSEYCFIVLKEHGIKKRLDSNGYTEYGGDGLDFINQPTFGMLISSERGSHFSFHKELDAKSGRGGVLEFFVDNKFEIRCSVKVNMSLEQLNALFDSVDADWHGKKALEARKILKASARESYMDVKDKKTDEWYRVQTKEFNKKHTCTIS